MKRWVESTKCFFSFFLTSFIMFYFSGLKLSITTCYAKKNKKNNVYCTPQKTFENTIFKMIQIVLNDTNILWSMQIIKKLKSKGKSFESSNKSIYQKINFFKWIFYRIYINMCKKVSAKYYQGNKERLLKKLAKDIKIFLKKKKKYICIYICMYIYIYIFI